MAYLNIWRASLRTDLLPAHMDVITDIKVPTRHVPIDVFVTHNGVIQMLGGHEVGAVKRVGKAPTGPSGVVGLVSRWHTALRRAQTLAYRN